MHPPKNINMPIFKLLIELLGITLSIKYLDTIGDINIATVYKIVKINPINSLPLYSFATFHTLFNIFFIISP